MTEILTFFGILIVSIKLSFEYAQAPKFSLLSKLLNPISTTSTPALETADKYFKEGAKFPMTYYGHLSFKELDPEGNFELVDQSTFDKEYEKEFKKNRLINQVILLKELNAVSFFFDNLFDSLKGSKN